ncbi:uncharacterized protein PgNI_09718 [Pyricularia grisea]|uniref:Uncharacterized protein n=1 Tax=Pyricularia grisea TaxID=148305 RepID=A0A6P8ATR5_PYRGI|nr:uncharacterized protein PgNI_09718 [Pyricularia grisea]TLD05524.1 hypothetical protein PgNI_09718 [Pyricularia grisea]
MSSNRDGYREWDRDRDRERDRERDKERAYRDYRHPNNRDDRRDRDPNDRRDHESGLEQERSARFSSTRTGFDSTVPLSAHSSVTSESNPPPYKKVADVMRKMLQLQNKRTPIQDRKSAVERHIKEKEDMYQKTRSKHIEYPSLSETQDNYIRRLRQELKELEGELGKIDEELSHMCSSFATSLLNSLPEMQKNENALALSTLESRCGNIEKGLEATLKAHKFAGENQHKQQLEDELKAHKAALNTQSEQILRDDCKTLQAKLRDEFKQTLEAHQASLNAHAEQKLEESRQALQEALRDEFKQTLEAHQASLNAHAELKLEESRQALQEALRDEFKKGLDAHKATLDAYVEHKLEEDRQTLRVEFAKSRQAEVEAEPQQKHGAGKELQTGVTKALEQIATLGNRIKQMEEGQEDISSFGGLLENFKGRLNSSEQSRTDLSVKISTMENTLSELQRDFSSVRNSFESRLDDSEKSSQEQSEQIKSVQNILRGCHNGVEFMITNTIQQIGILIDKANERIAVLERISAQRSEAVQVDSRISGEANGQVQEGFNVDHQKSIANMDEKYRNFVKDVNDRHEKLEETFQDKYSKLGETVQEKYTLLVKTIEDNYKNLNNICWGLEEQYQNVNSKDLFQRIIAEASNMLPNSVGNLSTEVNRLNCRLAGIEQQMVNQNLPDQKVRKRQRTIDDE